MNTDPSNYSTDDREQFDFYVAELETYLDGELGANEASAVRGRLAAEPAYAAALGRLHAERLARAAAFDGIERGEIDDAAAGRLVAAARRTSMRRTGLPAWARVAGGMAACVVVGFAAGYLGGFDLGPAPAKPSPTPFATNPDAPTNTGWVRYEEGRPVETLPESVVDPRRPEGPRPLINPNE